MVQDNGQGNLSANSDVTISVTDINEPPVIFTQSLTVDVEQDLIQHEMNNIKIGVGILDVEDPDFGQTITYEITSGNDRNIWMLNSATGELSLINPYELNPVEVNNYPVQITATDNGAGNLSATSTVYIYVNIYIAAPGNENTLTNVDNNTSFDYSMYPNPVNDQFNLEFSNVNSDVNTIEVSIHNMNGELMQKQSLSVNGREFSDRIDVSWLSEGMYIVILNHGKVSKYGKFIKR